MGFLRAIDAQFGVPYADPREELDRQVITGNIRTVNGSAVPDDLTISVTVRGTRPQGLDNQGRRTEFAMKPRRGRFEATTKFGYVSFNIDHPDFAPQVLGPMLTTPGGSLNFDIALDPGFTAHVRVADPDGLPIAGAQLKTMQVFMDGRWIKRTMPKPQIDSGTDGVLSIPHCAAAPTRIFAVADGLIDRDLDLDWSPPKEGQKWASDRVIEHRMSHVMPITGRVLSPEGKPVGGATLSISSVSISDLGGMTTMMHGQDQSIASTNNQGDFSIASISTRGTVKLVALSPDGGRAVIDGVKAGTTGLMMKLQPAATLRGRLTGALERIIVDGKPTIYFDYTDPEIDFPCPVSGIGAPSGYHEGPQRNRAVDVRIRNGTGEFEIPRLYHGHIVLIVSGEVSFYPVEGKDLNVKIDVPAQPAHRGSDGKIVLQEVTATLAVPQGRAPAEGFVHFVPLWDCDGPWRWGHWGERFAAAHLGKASLGLPVPNNQVTLYSDSLIGYTFDPVWIDLGMHERQADAARAIEGKKETVIQLRPAGAIYGSLGAAARIYARCKTKPIASNAFHSTLDENEPPIRYNATVNNLRRTYVIHSVPLAAHLEVLAETDDTNGRSIATLIEDAVLNDDSSALRVDITAETLKKSSAKHESQGTSE